MHDYDSHVHGLIRQYNQVKLKQRAFDRSARQAARSGESVRQAETSSRPLININSNCDNIINKYVKNITNYVTGSNVATFRNV